MDLFFSKARFFGFLLNSNRKALAISISDNLLSLGADFVSLAVLREKDGKLRPVYAGWDDGKVVEPSEVLELRAS